MMTIKSTVILLLSLLVLSIYAQTTADNVNPSIFAGVEKSMQADYDSAGIYFQKIIAQDPESPIGYFFMAVLYHTMIIDYEEFNFEKDFMHYTEIAQEKIKQRKKNQSLDKMDHFMAGTLDGYQGTLDIKKGNWVSGFRYGLRGMDAVKQALALDPGFYDPLWCVGVYEFYRSKMTKTLWWLPFISDQREEGIAKLRLALEKSRYSRMAARQSLVWIYYGEKRYQEALDLDLAILPSYPHSRMLLWAVADCYYALKNWDQALIFYQRLFAETENNAHDNRFNSVICRWKIANIYFKQKEYKKTIAECQAISLYSLRNDIAERLHGKLDQARELQKKAEEELIK
jgi:tetratricopeptide (TPR) repeat protein